MWEKLWLSQKSVPNWVKVFNDQVWTTLWVHDVWIQSTLGGLCSDEVRDTSRLYICKLWFKLHQLDIFSTKPQNLHQDYVPHLSLVGKSHVSRMSILGMFSTHICP
jgi:hypothetical protein